MKKSASILKEYFLPDSNRWKFWLALALLFKSAFFLFQLSHGRPRGLMGFMGAAGGDTESYLAPVDHLMIYGTYSPDYRMPGYALLYYPLLLVFPKAVACNGVILVQLILASISVYCLALTARNCFQSNALF